MVLRRGRAHHREWSLGGSAPSVGAMRRLIILAAMAVAAVAPASASAHASSYYLSLGDSLAAGYNKDAKGVTRYSALGQPFDPTRHEAIARVVSVDAKPGTVIAETMPGYMLHNRVLRAALVSVAAAPDEDS